MRKFIVGSLAVIGALSILAVIVVVAILLLSGLSTPSVPGKTIVEINLERGLIEDVPDDAIAKAMTSDLTIVRDIVDGLERAGNDSRVAGVIARVGNAPMGMAQVQEIRDAVIAFRGKNKWAIAFAETFGEFGPGNNSYYLATAFDEIRLQPSGDLGLTGLMLEGQFIRGTLDKLGVQPRMDHRYEYKNAMNMYTEKQFTAPHREAMEKLLNSWFSQMVRGIAHARKMTEEEVKAIIDRGPLLGKEALDAKLVDSLAYRDEVYAEVKEKAGAGAQLLFLDKYLERAGRPNQSGKTIAVVYGVGAVGRGRSGFDPIFGDVSMGSDTVGAAFRAAIEDSSVKAIIFRVDSPGGSAVASDVIWRETIRAKQAGKPVIVSMGDVAGSGGYWVAMSADKIVAQPGTITGSIGVLGGKMLTNGLWDKVGLSWDEVHAGANATMWSSTDDYTPAEWSRFQAFLDRIYSDFTTKVAEGRKLPKERVLEIAKGRIWSGEDAKNLGLVDELGGFPVAVKLAREAAGMSESEAIRIQVYPAKKSTFDVLLGETPDNSERVEVADSLVKALRVIQPVARMARESVAAEERGIVEMPRIRSKR
ncbi:MAG TPA: signal peptide peptidase SppA [Blastocatellia bacterium]|nr:signal peptide peptidase SppA [Blastocatellia bacterium]